jgi:hypothetical protein
VHEAEDFFLLSLYGAERGKEINSVSCKTKGRMAMRIPRAYSHELEVNG